MEHRQYLDVEDAEHVRSHGLEFILVLTSRVINIKKVYGVLFSFEDTIELRIAHKLTCISNQNIVFKSRGHILCKRASINICHMSYADIVAQD